MLHFLMDLKGFQPLLHDFSGLEFGGNNFRVMNLCSIYKDSLVEPMGLFSRISGGTVKNLGIDNAIFKVVNTWSGPGVVSSEASDDEKNYSPVGALAGYIENSLIENMSIGKIDVAAPFAGGLAGYVQNSTVSKIKTMSNTKMISVSNEIVLRKNKKDSKMGSYKALLGGLAGASYSSSFSNVDIIPSVQNYASVESSALGGLAGLFAYDKDVNVEVLDVQETVHKEDVTELYRYI